MTFKYLSLGLACQGRGLGLGLEHPSLALDQGLACQGLACQGLGLGLEHPSLALDQGLACQGLGLGLELLSLEFKPEHCIY